MLSEAHGAVVHLLVSICGSTLLGSLGPSLGPLSVESNFAKLLGRTHLSNLTIVARHALHSHWWLPVFAYRACLRGLGHVQQRVS
jgi:hypothetical protein